MADTLPPPVVQLMLACREVFQDTLTGEHILLGPIHNVTALQFPTVTTMAVYVQMTSTHGSYRMGLRLENLDGRSVWESQFEKPHASKDPLSMSIVTFHRQGIHVPAPGRYDLVLLTNDAEASRYPFWANFPPPLA